MLRDFGRASVFEQSWCWSRDLVVKLLLMNPDMACIFDTPLTIEQGMAAHYE